jgi:RHS repeat-associated protein
LATLSDGNGNATKYYYNAAGYLNAVTFPGYSGGAPSFNVASGNWQGVSGSDSLIYTSYDGNGDLTSSVDGRGVVKSLTYNDPGNFLTNIHYTLPTPSTGITPTSDVKYVYDGFGRISSISNSVEASTYGKTGTPGYDDDGDILNITESFFNSAGTAVVAAGTLSYGYFPNGSRSSLSVLANGGGSSESFSYQYDADDRPSSLTNPFGETTTWSYYNNDWLASQADYNGAGGLVSTARYAYNGRGFLTDLANTNSTGSTLSEYGSSTQAIAYDAAGNLTSFAANEPIASGYSGSTSYSYDGHDQLTNENSSRNGGYSNTFNHDGAENPTTFRNASVTPANADSQLAIPSVNVFDGNGNPTTYGGKGLSFDAANHMTSYGATEANTFNPEGLRAGKLGANQTYYLYDTGMSTVCELNAQSSVTATNTIGVNGVISRNSASSSSFYCFDPQGNTSHVLTASGAVTANSMCDAYGSLAGGQGSPFLFGGKLGYYTDAETNLTLLATRFYDATLGRFINRDGAGYRGGINPYNYTANNPVTRCDPNGTSPIQWSPIKVDGVLGSLTNCAVAATMVYVLYTGDTDTSSSVKLCGAITSCISGLLTGLVAASTDQFCIASLLNAALSAIAQAVCDAHYGCPLSRTQYECLAGSAVVSAATGCVLPSLAVGSTNSQAGAILSQFLNGILGGGAGAGFGGAVNSACNFATS